MKIWTNFWAWVLMDPCFYLVGNIVQEAVLRYNPLVYKLYITTTLGYYWSRKYKFWCIFHGCINPGYLRGEIVNDGLIQIIVSNLHYRPKVWKHLYQKFCFDRFWHRQKLFQWCLFFILGIALYTQFNYPSATWTFDLKMLLSRRPLASQSGILWFKID